MAQFRFTPNDRPLFLSDHAKPEHRHFGKAWISVISSLVAAAVIIFAVLLVGNPLVLFANTTASRVSTSAPQDGSGQSTPTIQSSANAQALPPIAREAPAGDENFAAFKAAFENKTEVVQPTAAVMFIQFQAWAAKEYARAAVRPPQPVQDPPNTGSGKSPSTTLAKASTGPSQAYRPRTGPV